MDISFAFSKGTKLAPLTNENFHSTTNSSIAFQRFTNVNEQQLYVQLINVI